CRGDVKRFGVLATERFEVDLVLAVQVAGFQRFDRVEPDGTQAGLCDRVVPGRTERFVVHGEDVATAGLAGESTSNRKATATVLACRARTVQQRGPSAVGSASAPLGIRG